MRSWTVNSGILVTRPSFRQKSARILKFYRAEARKWMYFLAEEKVGFGLRAYVDFMKRLTHAKLHPSEIVSSQVCVETVIALLPIALIAVSLCVMPASVFILIYGFLSSTVLLVVYGLRRKGCETGWDFHTEELRRHESRDSLPQSRTLGELQQALILRTVQEIHARNHRSSSELGMGN